MIKWIKAIIYVVPLLFLASCSESSHEPLRIASSPWPGYEPLYLARDLGYLDEGKANLFELPSSDINMESFRNKSSDIATLTLDEALTLLNEGKKLRILAVLDISHGGDAVLVHPSIKKLSDVKGKRISIVNIPLGLFMLSRFLDVAGVERKDVDVFPMSESKQLEFYQQGKADVVITFEPVKTRLKKAGAKVIFDSAQIPNEIFDLLLIHEEVYQQRKNDACGVVKAWFKTLDYLKKHPEDSALRISKRLSIRPDDIPSMMDGIILPTPGENKKILGGDNPGLLVPARRLAKIMLDEKLLSQAVDPAIAIDPAFAECY